VNGRRERLNVMASAAPVLEAAALVTREYIAPGFWYLGCRAPKIARAARAAQFVAIDVPGEFSPRLPLGIWTAEADQVSFLFREWGDRTTRLARLHHNAEVSLLGPLGNAFEAPPEGARAIIAAGGLGIVPFWLLVKTLAASAVDMHVVVGARSKELIVGVDALTELGAKIHLCTDDGSAGRKGSVVDEVRDVARTGDVVYGCGPRAMLKALCEFANAAGVACQISMEETFGCSMGTCWGCVVPVKRESAQGTQYPRAPDERRAYDVARVCADGTVFRAADVLWPG